MAAPRTPVTLPGRMHAVFAVLLVATLALGAIPVWRHTQHTYRLRSRIALLVNSPMDADIAELLARLRAQEARTEAFHRMLGEAEDELWYLKSHREPALILKDVGDETGRIGLQQLERTFRRLREGAGELRGILGVSRLKWEALREKQTPARYRSLARELELAGQAITRQEALLTLYGELLTGTEGTIRRLRQLAPQVADPVPASIRGLPRRLEPVQAEMERLEAALHRLMRHLPAIGPVDP